MNLANPQPGEFQNRRLYKARQHLLTWLQEQKTLFEAILVALSLHVLFLPVIWFIGWALPWPKSPTVTTIVDYDLSEWLKSGRARRIFEYRDPKLNQ